MSSSDFSFANEERAFAIVEGSSGTLQKPAAANQMYTVGPVDFEQAQEFMPDAQIRASASQLSPIKGRKSPGTWSVTTYVKPSGTKGTAPEHDVLFKCAFGKGTPNAGVSYVYSLTNQLGSFSLWSLKGHSVFAFRGVTIQTARFNIVGGDISTINWSGNFIEQIWAGTCYAAGACPQGTTVIQLSAGHAALYSKDMYIVVGTDNNATAGYKITNINYGLDQITISPALGTDQGTGRQITPWYPSAAGEIGLPQHGKQGLVKIANEDTIVTGASVDLANNIKYYEDEKNNMWTAERFGRPKFRVVEGTVDLYFLKRGLSYFYRAEYQDEDALIIPVGNVAGYIMEISIPYAEWRTPRISGDEEFRQTVTFVARASASLNDEITVTFK